MKNFTKFGTALAILAGAAVLRAQDEPGGQDETKSDPEVAESKAKPNSVLAELGWASWDVDGSRSRMRQYATPPDGLYIKKLSWGPWLPNLAHGANLTVLTPGEDDYRYGGEVYVNYGQTYVDFGGSRHKFVELSPFVLPDSDREFSGGSLRHLVTRNFAVQLGAQLDEQNRTKESPLDPLHQRTRTYNAAIEGQFGAAHLGLGLTNWNYFDRTNVLPDTEANVWSLSYAQDLSPALSLGAQYVRSDIDQGSDRNSEVETMRFNGAFDIGEYTGLTFDFRKSEYDLPVVQNAYVRERSFGRARLSHAWSGWNFQVGYAKEDIERVRRDQTFVDTPSYHTFEFKANGRLSPNVRASVKGQRRSMDGSATMQTTDPRALYWRNRWTLQTKLDVATENAFGYLVYSFREDKNNVRDTQVRNHAITLGGTLQIRPEVDLFFEAASDNWSAQSADPEAFNLDSYFPDGSTYTVGLNWAIRPELSAGISYVEFGTRNDNPLGLRDNNVKGRFLTTSLRYRLPIGLELGLNLAPWSHSDRAQRELDYRSTYITLTGGLRF